MRKSILEQVSLSDQMGSCEPLDGFPAGVVPSLDVSEVVVRQAGPDHVEVVVGFDFDLSTPREQDIICDISASFRLIYRMKPFRGDVERRDWASSRPVVDAWPYWRAYLTGTMALMGLQPFHLSPEPPEELAESAREAFDIGLQERQEPPAGKVESKD